MFLINMFKRFFTKKPKPKVEHPDVYGDEIRDRIKTILELNLEDVDDPTYASTDPFLIDHITPPNPNNPNLLLVDDSSDFGIIYTICYKKLLAKGKNIFKDYNIYSAFHNKCSLTVCKFIKTTKIDYAILDITLGYHVKIKDNKYINIDGVDLAILIWMLWPECKLIFSTCHTLNKSNASMHMYHDKFKTLTNKELTDYYINKSSDSVARTLEHMLYGDKDEEIS